MFRIALGILSVCERYGVCWFNLLRIGHVIFLGLDFDTVIYFPLAMLFSFDIFLFLLAMWHVIFDDNVIFRWQFYCAQPRPVVAIGFCGHLANVAQIARNRDGHGAVSCHWHDSTVGKRAGFCQQYWDTGKAGQCAGQKIINKIIKNGTRVLLNVIISGLFLQLHVLHIEVYIHTCTCM